RARGRALGSYAQGKQPRRSRGEQGRGQQPRGDKSGGGGLGGLPGLHPDLSRHDDERQRGGLQQAAGHRAAAAHGTYVKQRGHSPHDQQGKEEERQLGQGRRM